MNGTVYYSWLKVVLLVVLAVPIVGIPLLLVAREPWRDVTTGSSCHGKLRFLALALGRYQDANGHLPPAYVVGPDGKPWHSWRVLLLPHMDIDSVALAKEYRMDEPWDGPNNRKLHGRMPADFACPGDPDGRAKGQANYFVVVGPDTAFPGAKPTKLSDFTRSPSDTILVVEAKGQGVCWLEPRDLSFADMSFTVNDPAGNAISAKHRRTTAALADGGTRPLQDVTPDDLRAMFLIRPPAK